MPSDFIVTGDSEHFGIGFLERWQLSLCRSPCLRSDDLHMTFVPDRMNGGRFKRSM